MLHETYFEGCHRVMGGVGKESGLSYTFESAAMLSTANPQALASVSIGILDALDLTCLTQFISGSSNVVMSHTPEPGLAAVLGLHASE